MMLLTLIIMIMEMMMMITTMPKITTITKITSTLITLTTMTTTKTSIFLSIFSTSFLGGRRRVFCSIICILPTSTPTSNKSKIINEKCCCAAPTVCFRFRVNPMILKRGGLETSGQKLISLKKNIYIKKYIYLLL